ncbi:MAG: DNA-directed RNA polymerase subunit beta', partial [bacterium]|nr:DNA-directed RNA polymerase subunit beta' [bacterium]
GRFRQNLLGKRVDYSGRSVIVVGPELKLWQCGLPKRMALELFRPFVIEKLIDRGIAHNIRGAGRIIEEEGDEVWAILEEVIEGKYVLLNRAPTLHRLSIQAFQPVLIEGLAIQIHPLVTSAFNADFDGDQMAVHLPITAKAQEEARRLMLASLGLLKPATGDPIAYPTRDMVLGCYWLTRVEPDAKGTGKRFASKDEAVLAYENGYIGLQAQVVVPGDDGKLETTVGRHIFNSALPSDFGYVNEEFSSKALKALVAKLVDRYGQQRTSEVVDKIKYIGFEYATRSGISWGMDDLVVPEEKPALIAEADKEIEAVRMNYENGLLTDDERRTLTIEAWERVRGKIEKLVPTRLDAFGTVATMIRSGARGSWNQPVQMMGMRGLMANPTGDIIELPVRSSLKEGMNVLEYFISTHGARKGTADTALRTSAAGYLTRRLIDVSQDVVVRDADCGDTTGITFWREDATELGKTFAERLRGRVIIEGKGKFRVLGLKEAREVDEAGADRIQLRSVTACKTRYGVCQMCYGWDLARNELVAIGTPVGIVAAQAIGEPGTQLTMRTFHTGGVAGGADITQGLPRVEEVFEARSPKWKGVIAEVDGICEDVKEEGRNTLITVATDEGTVDYTISAATAPLVKKGDKIVKGAALCEGHIDLKELYRISGSDAVRRYVIHEVQKIYSLQGADINDRHIEVIARQIFARVRVKNPGDTTMAEGEVVERNRFEEENEQVSRMGGKEAEGQELLMGITKVALSTESFLSAASFQDTARVLIQSAIEGRIDRLQGLKENVIIGRLIPAGTGFHAEQK